MVVAHEVSTAARNCASRRARYQLQLRRADSYGPGDAVTKFQDEIEVSRADALGIDTGGIEAQNVLADRIRSMLYKSNGFVRGERLHAGPIIRVGMTYHP